MLNSKPKILTFILIAVMLAAGLGGALIYAIQDAEAATPVSPGAMFTISMDDGYASDYNVAFPILQANDIPATSFVITSAVNNAGRMTTANLLELQAAGWDIGSHTVSHPFLDEVTPAEVEYQLSESRSWLESQGIDVRSFAYPGGGPNNVDHDAQYLAAKYYEAVRDTTDSPMYITPSTNLIGNGRVGAIGLSSYDLATVQSYIDEAITQGAWLNVYIHALDADGTVSGTSLKLQDVAAYVKAKADAGLITPVTFIDGMYRTRNAGPLTTTVYSQHGWSEYMDLSRVSLADASLRVYGVTQTNVLTNPDMETRSAGKPTGWTVGSGITASAVSSDVPSLAHVGPTSYEITYDPAASASDRRISQNVDLASKNIQPGQRIYASAYVKNVADCLAIEFILQFHGAGGFISQSGSWSHPLTTNWGVVTSGVLTVPEGATTAVLYMAMKTTTDGASSGKLRVDGAVMAKQTFTPSPYTLPNAPFFYQGTTYTEYPEITINGVTHSFDNVLPGGQYVEIPLSESGKDFLGGLDIGVTSGGHGFVRLEVVGTRVIDCEYGDMSYLDGEYTFSHSSKTSVNIHSPTVLVPQDVQYVVMSTRATIGTVTIDALSWASYRPLTASTELVMFHANGSATVTFSDMRPNAEYSHEQGGVPITSFVTDSAGNGVLSITATGYEHSISYVQETAPRIISTYYTEFPDASNPLGSYLQSNVLLSWDGHSSRGGKALNLADPSGATDGELMGDVSLGTVSGARGLGTLMDGVDDYIRFPVPALTSGTLIYVFERSYNNVYETYLSGDDTYGNGALVLSGNGYNLLFSFYGAAGMTISGHSTPGLGNVLGQHCLMFAWTEDSYSVYLDGMKVDGQDHYCSFPPLDTALTIHPAAVTACQLALLDDTLSGEDAARFYADLTSATVNARSTYEYQPAADQTITSWSMITDASWLRMDNTGRLYGVPTIGGTWAVSVRATNAQGLTGFQNFTIATFEVPPRFLSSPVVTVDQFSEYSYTIMLDQSVTLICEQKPYWLAMNGHTGTLSGTALESGDVNVVLRAEGAFETTYQNYTITVAEQPTTPGWSDSTPDTDYGSIMLYIVVGAAIAFILLVFAFMGRRR